MTSLWFDNLALLRQRWPHLWQWLTDRQGQTPPLLDVPPRVNGLQLASAHDPEGEAMLQAQPVPAGEPLVWVYGVGGGLLPEMLLARPGVRELRVVVLSAATLAAALAWRDQRAWLADPRTRLLSAAEAGEQVRRPFAAATVCLSPAPADDPVAGKVRERVLLELATPFLNRDLVDHPLLRQRLADNAVRVAADGDVATLFNSRPASRVLLALPGPSLGRHLDWLAHRSSDWPLLTVGAALPPLQAAGILPDIIVTIDPFPIHLASFDHDLAPLAHVPLVYFPVVEPALLDRWPGPRLTAYSASPLYRELATHHPKGVLFSAGSVLHPLVDLAVRLGAREVVLLGADLAFPGGRCHVEGYEDDAFLTEAGNRLRVPDGQGGLVETLPVLNHFRVDLERYLAVHAEVTFFVGSRAGARINGARFLDETPWGQAGRAVPAGAAPVALVRPPAGADRGAIEHYWSVCRQALNQRRWQAVEELLGTQPPPWSGEDQLTWLLGWSELALGRDQVTEAARWLDQALQVARESNARLQEGRARRLAALFHHRLRRWEDARHTLADAMNLALACDAPDLLGQCLMTLGQMHADRLDNEEAVAVWQDAEALFVEHQLPAEAIQARQRWFTLQLRAGTDEAYQEGAELLQAAARDFRCGATGAGSELLRRAVEWIGDQWQAGKISDGPALAAVLRSVGEAQQRGDWVALGDLLAHELPQLAPEVFTKRVQGTRSLVDPGQSPGQGWGLKAPRS